MGRERDKSPDPDHRVECKQQEIDDGDLAPLMRRSVVKCRSQMAEHEGPRITCRRRERGPKDSEPSFRSSTGTPRPVFVASTRSMAGLLARGSSLRPAFPAQTLCQWLNRTKLPAHSCGGSC